MYGKCGLQTSKSYVLGCKMYEEPDCHFMKRREEVTEAEWKLIDIWGFGH
ncbi:hypothetical protein ANCCAN_05744 [Ancylostoma caninum]|uniref:Uncharacterized protein n=1 Tax=Ancylostoma caninum TaxID=29170 RepID=A0A368GX95_ANCCA|nr:hypothetical protein ANCCAN_05744 [Ancylostoma caninum]